MIKITMSNSQEVFWQREEYTDYRYDGKCFIVINKDKWVGIYNMDSIICIICK